MIKLSTREPSSFYELLFIWRRTEGEKWRERERGGGREPTCIFLAGLTFNLVQVSQWTILSLKPGTLANWPFWILCISLFSNPSIASHPNTVAFLPCLKQLGLVPSTLERCRAEIIHFSYMYIMYAHWLNTLRAKIKCWHLPGVKDKLWWKPCRQKMDLWS